MKKFNSVLLSVIINIVFFSFNFASEYYYSNNTKIPMSISNNEITLKFKENAKPDKFNNLKLHEPSLGDKISLKFAKCGELLCYNLIENEDIDKLINRIKALDDVEYVNPVYLINGKDRAYIYNQFTVQFHQHVSRV